MAETEETQVSSADALVTLERAEDWLASSIRAMTHMAAERAGTPERIRRRLDWKLASLEAQYEVIEEATRNWESYDRSFSYLPSALDLAAVKLAAVIVQESELV